MNFVKINKIPLNKTTAYLAGVIIGDGHISNSKKSKNALDYNIAIETVDKEYLLIIIDLIKQIVPTISTIKQSKERRGKRQSYYFQIRNKSLYYFLTSDLAIPAGKKCYTVTIPKLIFSSVELQKQYLAGLFDTDGGIRGSSIGFTSASKDLIMDISIILTNLQISHYTESWINKKYNKSYYGLKITKKERDKFLNLLPIRNVNK